MDQDKPSYQREFNRALTPDEIALLHKEPFAEIKTVPPPSAWSDEPPTKPGWYWCKIPQSDTPRIAHIMLRLRGSLAVLIAGEQVVALEEINHGVQWQPVQEPRP